MTEPADQAERRKAAIISPQPVSPWAFGPRDREILVGNAEILLAQLPFFLGGWPCRRLDDSDGREMDITIREHDGGRIDVRLTGPGAVESVFENEFEAADGLATALIAAYVGRDPDTFCLHAGSAQIGSGIVVMLGDSMAGKSSVALHLAASGYRLFGDDRLAVLPENGSGASGLCLGLTPKVRLPLPDDCAPKYREYVDSFTEIRSDDVAYLKLWEGEAAVFLDRAPIRAFVVLNRLQTGKCSLLPATRPTIVKALLAQCFAPQVSAQDLVISLTRLASGAAGYDLTFSSSEEAAALLSSVLRNEGED